MAQTRFQSSFQQAIHTADWWAQERAISHDLIAPYLSLLPEEVTPETTMRLFNVLVQQVERVTLITQTLALEHSPSRRGRSLNRSARLAVTTNRAHGAIEFMGTRLTPAQACSIGIRLIAAADEIGTAANLTADTDR